MNKFLIVGLGNIGVEYEHTRHNIGFDILDHFVNKHKGEFTSERLAFRADLSIKGRKIICIKPTTFMNLSGRAVKYWLEKEKIEIANMLVLVDELAVPLNKIKMKPAGNDGGHNGLRSIQETLLTAQYPRLRFGIGNEFSKGKQVEYVLGHWKRDEEDTVARKIEYASQAIEDFVFIGLEKTMTEVNQIEL
jgi:PTH1 family peptidyl-tRNA hydrolase